MGIEVIKPIYLISIPIALIIFFLISRRSINVLWKESKSHLIIRGIVIILLGLALSGITLYWKADKETTIFIVDNSHSVFKSKDDINSFVSEAIRKKGSKDLVGVVSFGEDAKVESFVSKNSTFNKVESTMNSSYTNIENAMSTALSLFPSNSKKRIVLVSDGEENYGEALRLIPSLEEQGVELKLHKLEKNIDKEVAINGVSVPQTLNLGEEFSLTVSLNSTIDTTGKLVLYSGNEKVGEERVNITKGLNKYVFKDKATNGGFKSYRVTIEPEVDGERQNNEGVAFTEILSKPKVLVLEAEKGEGENIFNILKSSGIDFKTANSLSAPTTLEELSYYKSIILCNVPVHKLPKGFLDNIESYVKDIGGGFIAIGGEDSFALGGYNRTSLEKVLPVNMDMKGKKETPKMALGLIIDKSGSMMSQMAGVTKVDMAKEAAIRSLASLRDGKDEIAVIAFDDNYEWAQKRTIINDVKGIEGNISGIMANGGTTILPPFKAMVEELKKSDAKIKHIILLTDGQAERSGYDNPINEAKKNNITVSTVAVGSDSDTNLLRYIADNSGGRIYVTDEYTSIPTIFTKETFLAKKTYLNNKEFTPIINTSHNVLSGVAESGLPSLLGYIGASPKDKAKMVLKSDDDDPILTLWQYGLGRAVAWNSDMTGKWSRNFIGWNKTSSLWQNLINFTVDKSKNDNVSLSVQDNGGKALITLTDKNGGEGKAIDGKVIDSKGVTTDIKLEPIAPGQYSMDMNFKDSGVYMISAGGVVTGHAVQYSPEYRINTNANIIDTILKEGKGILANEPSEVYKGSLKDIKGQRDLTLLLLSLGLILFLLDIVNRRMELNLVVGKFINDKFMKNKVKVTKKPTKQINQGIIEDNEDNKKDEEIKHPKDVKKKTKAKEVSNKKKESIDTSALLNKKKFK